MAELGEKLKEERYKRQLTQTEMAKLLGISRSAYSLYESGKRQLSIDLLKQICFILKIDLEQFVDWQPVNLLEGVAAIKHAPYYLNDEAAEMAQEIYEDPNLKMLFDASRNVSKEDLQLIVDMVKRLKSNENDQDD